MIVFQESFPEEFDSMMDQLLDRDTGGEPNILAEVGGFVGPVENISFNKIFQKQRIFVIKAT